MSNKCQNMLLIQLIGGQDNRIDHGPARYKKTRSPLPPPPPFSPSSSPRSPNPTPPLHASPPPSPLPLVCPALPASDAVPIRHPSYWPSRLHASPANTAKARRIC